ncbi:DUF930 domain-containing protein [Bradyrhizobium sp. 31Argb]|uniref:DUF930 domain-containing protein n=1 Tax=unclassified Bradyrhizobium TaxID=2631580 RepID=UPI001FDEFED8|nr:DUF930 domain-containing protein [Bradyrhizobium sp. Leo170]
MNIPARLTLCVALLATLECAPATAKTIQQQLLSLDPQTRIEQRCNGRAAGLIGREHSAFKPDEVVAYAFAEPVLKGNALQASGAAIRSRGHWYHLSYACRVTSDGLGIETFSYKLGAEVPRAIWAEHYLVP